MQELTNVLLASSGKSAGASSKDAVQGVENETFSLALSEANGQVESRVNAKTVDMPSKKDETLLETEALVQKKPLDSTQTQSQSLVPPQADDSLEVDDSDVALIFAQIELASGMQLRQLQSQGGEFLPAMDSIALHTENLDVSFQVQIDSVLGIGNGDESVQTDERNGSHTSEECALFEDITPVIKFRGERVDFVTLADVTGLNQEQLTDLSDEELRQVIAAQAAPGAMMTAVQASKAAATLAGQINEVSKAEMALQELSQVVIESQAEAEHAVSKSQTEAEHALGISGTLLPGGNLTPNQGMAIAEDMTVDLDILSRSGTNRESSPGFLTAVAQLMETPVVTKAVNAATASLVAQVFTPSAVQTVQAQSVTGADPELGSTMSETEALSLLRGAQLSMGVSAEGSSLENVFADTTQDAREFKPVTSIAGFHSAGVQRGDVPLFQLSLRQDMTQQQQMQDMIQRFAPVMQQQLITMVSKGIQQAEIRLDPPELGQMMIRIQVQGDQTQVHFQVAQHQTRDLLDQALPRLREMLAAQGMQLADGQVAHDGAGRDGKARDQQTFFHSGAENLDDFAAEEPKLTTNMTTSYASGIDYYA